MGNVSTAKKVGNSVPARFSSTALQNWFCLLHKKMKKRSKRSEATQTLRAGCSKADPQTNTQTDRGDYNTLRRLARSIITAVMCLNALTAYR